MGLYYLLLFILTNLYADLSTISIFKIGTFNIYLIDIIFIWMFWLIIKLLKVKSNFNLFGGEKFLLYFFSIFIVSVMMGLLLYGYRAFGEGRYIYIYLLICYPLYLYYKGYLTKDEDFEKIIEMSILIPGIASLLLFFVELHYGGRFFLSEANIEFAKLEDFRGTRYLGSEETYSLLLMSLYWFVKKLHYKNLNISSIVLILLTFAIVIFTRNRTATVALLAGFIIVMVFFEKRLKTFWISLLFSGISFFMLLLLFPTIQGFLIKAFSGIFDIMEDSTGRWRYYVQMNAISQAMERPFLGYGYGSYFSFYIPEFNQIIEYPPHSMYVYILLKSGLIGLLSLIGVMVSFIYQAHKLKSFTKDTKYEPQRIILVVAFVSQIFYCFAYNLSRFWGLYIGLFILLKMKVMSKS